MKPLSERVDKLINWNTELIKFGDKATSETKEIKMKIEKTIEEMNNLVYNLYGITDKEKEIIEGF